MPILQLANTSLIALSSPAGDTNYFSELIKFKKKGTNDLFFNVIECMQICKRCQKLDRVKQIECTHVRSTAHWLSSRKQRELKELYRTNPEDAIREFGGMVMSDSLPALRKEDVARFFQRPKCLANAPPPFIFTTCDPSAGTPKSHLAICSAYYNPSGELVVSNTYMCSARCTNTRTMSMMFASPKGNRKVDST